MNSKHVSGITIVSIQGGQRLGQVVDLLLDPSGRSIAAFVVQTGGGGILAIAAPETSWLPAENVRAVGPDAVTVDDAACLREFAPDVDTLSLSDLFKRTVVTESGVAVGPIASIEFDERRMSITAMEISTGFFKSNRFISTEHLITLGPEFAVVSDIVCSEESGDALDEGDTTMSRRDAAMVSGEGQTSSEAAP
jgi:uncharacterized protein YrrD